MIYQSRLFQYSVLLIYALLLIPSGYGAKMAWDKQTNRVEDWLPESFEETKQLIWFIERFGSDELMMVSWEGCTFSDERLVEFAKRLQEPTLHNGAPVQWFKHVWSGADVLKTMTSNPIEVSEQEAIRRMRGWLVGPDGETTCAIALASLDAIFNREAAVNYALSVADSIDGLSSSSIILAGPTYDGIAINKASKQSLVQLNVWSFLVCIVIIYVSLKNVKLSLCLFIASLYNEQAAMAMMYYSGVQMDSVLLLVANLAFVLTIAAGIHLINYYLDAVRAGSPDPVGTAVQMGYWPTLMCSITAIFGMISLCVSLIIPIKNFGWYSSLSMVQVTISLFTLLPVLIAWSKPTIAVSAAGDEAAPDGTSIQQEPDSYFWSVLSSFVQTFRWGIVVVALGCLVYGAGGLMRLSTSARLYDLFSEDAQLMRDYAWLEKNVAYLVPVEIVVEYPLETEADKSKPQLVTTFVRRMEQVEALRQSMAGLQGVGGTLMLSDFTPPLEPDSGPRRLAQRRLRIQAIYDSRPELEELGLLRIWEETELWRISLRVSSGREVDYGVLIHAIEQQVAEVFADQPEESRPKVYICGGVPLIFKTQGQLLDDLVSSFGLAVAMIAIPMIVLIREVQVGVLTIIPIVIPGMVVFGTMGWLGITAELGSIMTATVAMGISIDDTLHFVTWYRRGKVLGKHGRELLAYAYNRCGAAMVETALICSLGLVVFAFSPFIPIARFAWLMFTMLLLSVISNLVVFPVILLIASRRLRNP